MKRLLARIVVVVLLSAGVARAEGVSRVGVVVATRVNVTEGEADALASALADALRDRLVTDAVAGAEARRRLPPGGVEEDCVARAACVSDIAERLGADQVLFLVVVRIGPRVQIDSTWARPSTGQVVSRAAMVIEDGKRGAPEVFGAAARRLLPDTEPRTVHAAVVLPQRTRGRHVTRGTMIAGAASVVALAGGIGLALAARSDYDDLEADGCDQTACAGVDGRVDSMEHKALAADVLFGASAVAAGVAVFLYLGSGAEHAPVTVSADPDGAHVWLEKHF